MRQPPLLFHFPDDAALAATLTARLRAQTGSLQWHQFPDRESLITLAPACAGREVIVVCGLNNPDSKVLPLYFAASTARELGAERVGLVAPYLAYMRQDTRFREGQSQSAFVFGRLLSSTFDWLVTVDPHLHRITKLEEVYSVPATAVSAVAAIAQWIGAHVRDPVLIGPDCESIQWAHGIAGNLDAPWTVLRKVRAGDRDVQVSLPERDVLAGRTPVIVDDIASSGRTLVETVRMLRSLGAAAPTCIVIHALFENGAEAAVLEAGAAAIVSTNTVPHSTNAIDIESAIAEAVSRHLAAQRRS